jgi:predicted DNA-binding transcriptional regulator YafY
MHLLAETREINSIFTPPSKSNIMAQIKHALMRYRLIDKAIRNKNNPYPTKKKLRDLCEEQVFGSYDGVHICDSTIEKDLFAMRNEYDAPIEYSAKHRGYFYSDPNYSIDQSPLTESDLSALKFATSTLSQFRNNELMKEFGHALDKIVSKVEQKDSVAKNRNFIQFETGFGSSGQEHIDQLMRAIENRNQILFDYQSFTSEEVKRRKVSPLLLKEYRNRWYLICFDIVRDRISTFGLDRMRNLELSDLKFQVPLDFNPDYYFQHTVGITVTGSLPEKVVFKASTLAAKYIDTDPIHASQVKLKEGKKRVSFELRVMITEELIRLFLSYGSSVEILEPESLREEMKLRVRNMSENYGL